MTDEGAVRRVIMLLVKSIAVWTVLVVVAIANGLFHQSILGRYLAEGTAHQVSSVLGSLLILLTTSALIPTLGVTRTGRLFAIGLLWLVLTVAFEFLFGHFVAGDPWERLVADYDLSKGRLWLLVLATTFLAPLLAARLRGVCSADSSALNHRQYSRKSSPSQASQA